MSTKPLKNTIEVKNVSIGYNKKKTLTNCP